MATPAEFLVAYLGLAGLALWLLDRSHRSAFEKLSAIYDKEIEHQLILIDVLKMAIRDQPYREDEL